MGIESKSSSPGENIKNLSLPEIESALEVLRQEFEELDNNPFSSVGDKVEFQQKPEGLVPKSIIFSASNFAVAKFKVERMQNIIDKIKALFLRKKELQPK